MRENRKLLRAFLKEQRYWLGAMLCAVLLFALLFVLCHLPMMVLYYTSCLYLAVQVALLAARFISFRRRHRERVQLQNALDTVQQILPQSETLAEQDYQALIAQLVARNRALLSERDRALEETEEYHTLWAHQIKVPIAAIRLLLQTEPCDNGEEMQEKLFEIEQYVGMMLCFQRLSSIHDDLSLQWYDLENVTRQAVRKYARMFIRRKIKMDFPPFHCRVLTDEKWLSFIIEQILSNALKYTPQGGTVSIRCDEDRKSLQIRDTGIGIAAEDLPRVFERGFTGANGRRQREATGLGLYLCRRTVQVLSHEIKIESSEGQGTTVTLLLDNISIMKD